MVPVGGGLFALPLLFAGFFDRVAAFFTGFFAAFFLAMRFSFLGCDVARNSYQRRLKRWQYQSSSRTRRA